MKTNLILSKKEKKDNAQDHKSIEIPSIVKGGPDGSSHIPKMKEHQEIGLVVHFLGKGVSGSKWYHHLQSAQEKKSIESE